MSAPRALTKRMQKCIDSRLRRGLYYKKVRAKHLQQTKQLRGYLAPARRQREARRFPPANQCGEDARKRNAATLRLSPLSESSSGQKRWSFRPAARTDGTTARHYYNGEPITGPRPWPNPVGQPCPRRAIPLHRGSCLFIIRLLKAALLRSRIMYTDPAPFLFIYGAWAQTTFL